MASLFHGQDEWRHPSQLAATFQYHPESERSMFSWDDLAVSSSWYPNSVLWKCLSAATELHVHRQLCQVERYDQIVTYAFSI